MQERAKRVNAELKMLFQSYAVNQSMAKAVKGGQRRSKAQKESKLLKRFDTNCSVICKCGKCDAELPKNCLRFFFDIDLIQQHS